MQAAYWTATPDPENVARIRRAVRDYASAAGFGSARLHELTLAVSEIVANAVLHAYRDGGNGSVMVAAEDKDDALMVRVADDGVGLSPRTDSPGAGLGLVIASNVADRLEIDRPEAGGTEVRLTFSHAA